MPHDRQVKKKRERTTRRENERDLDKLEAARTKLAALEVGGSPERPAEVDSASQIEGRAEALPCFRCDHALKIVEHRALHHSSSGSVRELALACPKCGTKRRAYFRVRAAN